jgi:DNA-binding FadR family transcriptional regulator
MPGDRSTKAARPAPTLNQRRDGSAAASRPDNPAIEPDGGPLKRGQRKSLVVARALADELFAQRVDDGERLANEDDLMRRLGVSRSTLREALRLLETLGVVESRMGRTGGIVLHRPDSADFASTMTFYLQFTDCTFRQLLEVSNAFAPLVYGAAARNATPAMLHRLDGVMQMFNELPLPDQVRYDPVVRGVIAETVGNPIWTLFSAALQAVVQAHLERMLVPEDRWPLVVKNLRTLVAAIAARDVERAEHLGRQQAQAWFDVAERTQRDLLDQRITWTP